MKGRWEKFRILGRGWEAEFPKYWVVGERGVNVAIFHNVLQ